MVSHLAVENNMNTGKIIVIAIIVGLTAGRIYKAWRDKNAKR